MIVAVVLAMLAPVAHTDGVSGDTSQESVHLGPRPFYLIDKMEEGELKSALQKCLRIACSCNLRRCKGRTATQDCPLPSQPLRFV